MRWLDACRKALLALALIGTIVSGGLAAERPQVGAVERVEVWSDGSAVPGRVGGTEVAYRPAGSPPERVRLLDALWRSRSTDQAEPVAEPPAQGQAPTRFTQAQQPPAPAPKAPGQKAPAAPDQKAAPPMAKPPAPPMPKPAAPMPPMPPMPPIPSPTTAPTAPVAPRFQIRVTDFLSPTTSAGQSTGGGLSSAIAPAATPGAASTGEALQRAPSVNIRRTSALNLDPRIRGFHSNQINASANGFALQKTRVDIDSLFSNIDSGIVSNITVIDGPYSSLYGPGFGFLVAELMPSPRYENGLEVHGKTTLSTATNGRANYIRQNILAGSVDWGVFASYGHRAGNDYHPGGDSFDFRVPASYRQWDGFMAVGLDLSSRSRLEFNYIRNEKNGVELPGVVYDIANSKDEEISLRYVMQENRQGVEQAVLQTWWSRTPYHGDALRDAKRTTFYTPYITNRFFGFAPPNNQFNLFNTIAKGSLQTAGVRGLLTWGDLESARLTIGTDWRRYEQFYRESHIDFLGQPFQIIFGDNVFGIPKSSMEDVGFLAHYINPLSESVTVTAGGRLDHTWAFVHEDEINAGGSLAGLSRPQETLSMGYGTVEVELSEAVTANAGLAYAMRGPHLAELYSDGPFVPLVRQGNSIIIGNSELDPERNWQVDLGLSGEWERLDGGIRMYHSSIHNYILYTFDGFAGRTAGLDPLSARQYTYRNIDRATIWGSSVFGEYEIRPGLAFSTTMAYVKGTNHDPQPAVIDPATGFVLTTGGVPVRSLKNGEGLPGIYPFNTTLGLRLFDTSDENDPRWSLLFSARIVDDQIRVADSLFEDQTAGFLVYGVSGHVRVGESMRISSAIENLFDNTYTEHGSLVVVNPAGARSFVKEPGINWRLGVELEY